MASISQIYNLVSYGTMKKKQLIKPTIIIIIITCLITITATQAKSTPGCWPDYNKTARTRLGSSICPSDYKHANQNPDYKEYEPIPMTIYEAHKKGWKQSSSSGRINNISYEKTRRWNGKEGELILSESKAKKIVKWFCTTKKGGRIPGKGRENRNIIDKDYNRVEIHPRICPPDQYPYHNKNEGFHLTCSGTDPYELKPTPKLRRWSLYKKIDAEHGKNILEYKYEGLCPKTEPETGRVVLPICKPAHRLGYQILIRDDYGLPPMKVYLDCRRGEPGEGEGEEGEGEAEEEKECSQEDYESNEKYKKLPEKCKIGKCGKTKELKPKEWETKNIIPEIKKAISQKLKLKTDNSEKIEIQNITAETKVDNQCGKIKIGEREFNDCVITGVLHIFRYPILIKLATTLFRKI